MVPKERGKQIVSAVDFRKPKTEKEETDRKERRNPARQNGGYGLAVDIGTTTLAAALIALPEGKQLAAATCVNSQRVYGADVLSRILQANGGALADMREIVRRDLKSLASDICRYAGISEEQIAETVIAGNTTMQHIFAGESCAGLGQAPFAPGDISLRHFSEGDRDVVLLPGISAFVGADVVAGIYALGITEREEAGALSGSWHQWRDGALGRPAACITASTAAGPAFEGGKLKNGAASVPGAICGVRRERGRSLPETIGDQRPVGICGTGGWRPPSVCFWRREDLLGPDGTNDGGTVLFPGISPLDSLPERADLSVPGGRPGTFQMAKSAICSGVEILMEEAALLPRRIRLPRFIWPEAWDALWTVGRRSISGCCRPDCPKSVRAWETAPSVEDCGICGSAAPPGERERERLWTGSCGKW